MITAVVFDFGNVLYTFDYSRFFNALTPWSPYSPAEIERTVMAGGENAPALQFESGRLREDEFFNILRERARVRLEDDQIKDLFTDIFMPNEPIVRLATTLARQMPIALLSNTNETHFERFIRHAPVFSVFSAVALSYRVGAMKPAEAIFRSVLKDLGRVPGECVFIDDVPEYVLAAKELGFNGIRYKPDTDLISELAGLGVHVSADE